MSSASVFVLTFSFGFVGLALSADSGFDWGTDDDDEYESPFADDTDDSQDEGDDPPPDDEFDWDTDASGDEYESPFADDGDEVFELEEEPDDAGEPSLTDAADESEESEDGEDASPPASTGDGSGEAHEMDDSDDDAESSVADDTHESSSPAESEPEPPSTQVGPSGPEMPSGSEASPEADASPGSETPPESDESNLATVADARALCDEAMSLLHAGETARAFDRLSAHWAFSQDEMTQLQREVERTRAVVADRYGDALDYQLLREDAAGDVLARFVYLERFELHGLRWRFTFYEGASGWTLNDVFFDDEIEALLE